MVGGLFGGTNRARIHAEREKQKKINRKNAKKSIPQQRTYGFQLPASVRHFLGIEDDKNPDLPTIGASENRELKALSFGYFEKIGLLEVYREMCGTSKTVNFKAFCSYFKMKPDKWVRRVFEIINSQVNGSFSLLEFIQFVGQYLYINMATTEEFCFRILSRRGINFLPLHSILDLDDFVTFVALRYKKYTRLPKQRQLALELLAVTDGDGDGGVCFQEFQAYCRSNATFLKLTHPIQNHLRKCVMGMEFWVDKSRTIRTTRSSALEVVAGVGGRINRESEMYTLKHIGDPVIDNKGKALKTKQRPPRDEDSDDDSVDSDVVDLNEDILQSPRPLTTELLDQVNTAAVPVSVTAEGVEGEREGTGQLVSEPSLLPPPIQLVEEGSLASMESAAGLLDKGLSNEASAIFLTKADSRRKEKETRKKISFFGSFSTTPDDKLSFRSDFPDVIERRVAKKKRKNDEEMERQRRISLLSSVVFLKLVTICSDMAFGRLKLRLGFNKWLESQSMKSKAIVRPPSMQNMKKTVSRYRQKESENLDYRPGSSGQQMPELDNICEAEDEDEEVHEFDDHDAHGPESHHQSIHEQILAMDKNKHKCKEDSVLDSFVDMHLRRTVNRPATEEVKLDVLRSWAANSRYALDHISKSQSLA